MSDKDSGSGCGCLGWLIGALLVVAGIVVVLALCIFIFGFLIWGSLCIGGVIGFGYGTFKGFANYFSSLRENLSLES